MDEMKARYQDTLFRKSKELAMSLKHSDKSEEALKKEFEIMWESWLLELISDVPRVKNCNIWEDVMNILSESHEESVLNDRYKKGDYKSITFRGEYSRYVVPIEPKHQESEQANKKKKHNGLVTFVGNAWQKMSGYFKTHETHVLEHEHQRRTNSKHSWES